MPYMFYDYESEQWVHFNRPISEITNEQALRFLPNSAYPIFQRKLDIEHEPLPVAFLIAYSFSGRIIQES